MKRARRQYSSDWKVKIALEAIKGQRTIQQIASHYEIHPNVVTHWKKQLLEGAAANGDEELKAELYQQIGKLQMELDWLKKSPGCRVRGVVIVPQEIECQIVTIALEKARGEKTVRKGVEAGASGTTVFRKYGIL